MDDMASVGLRVDSRQVRNASGDLDRFAGAGDRAGGSAGKAKGAFAGMGKGLAIAAAGFAAIAGATRTLAEFGSSMSQVQAITNATATEMVKLTATAAKMGSTTEFSASQAAGGLRFLGMAGFSATESIAAMPAVLDLATSASMGLAEAADTASNIMSAFGIAATDASDVADVLAAAATSANTSVSQLGNAMAFVGPVASAMGVEMSDTAAAIGVLSDAGIQGSAAGTGLRRVLSSLANPTGAAAAALADLGVKLEDVNPATTSIVEIVDRLAASGISAADALTIFGDRGGPAILALTSQAGSLRELTESLSDVEGESARMATTMRDNLKGDMQSAMSAAEGLIIAMGEAGLTAVLRGIISVATDTIRFITGLVDAFGNLIDRIGGVIGLASATDQLARASDAAASAISSEVTQARALLDPLTDGKTLSVDIAGVKLAQARAHLIAADATRQEMIASIEASDAFQKQVQRQADFNEQIALYYKLRDEGVAQGEVENAFEAARFQTMVDGLQAAVAVQQDLLGGAGEVSAEFTATLGVIDALDALLANATGETVTFGEAVTETAVTADSLRIALGSIDMTNAIAGAQELSAQLGVSLHAAMQMMGLLGAASQAANTAVEFDPRSARFDADAAKQAARLERITATMDLLRQESTVTSLAIGGVNSELDALGGGSGGGSSGTAADGLDDATQAADDLADAMKGRLKSGISGVADAFGDFVSRGFQDFQGFVQSVIGSFKSMISQMISMAVRNRIMLSIGTAGGGVGQAVAGAAGGGGASGGMLSGLMGSFGTGKGMAGLAGGAGFLGGVGNVLGGLASGGLSGGIGAIGSALGGATASPGGFAMAAGAIALPLLAVAGIFSFFRTKTKELDAGIIATVTGVDTLVQSFRTVEKSRFFGLFKSVSTTIGAAGQATTDAITDIVGTLQGSVMASADALGLAGDTFEDFSHRMRISTKGLSEEAANEAIQDALMGMADAMAGMVSGLDAFARDGEGAAATLERLAQSLATVNGFMDAFQLRTYDVSLAGGAAAASFVDLFGSLDAFVNVAGSYYQNFFTDAERLARATELLSIEMLALGIDALPSTRAAFRALVDEADALGDSGLVASLMQLSPAFAEITAGADALGDSLRSLVNEDLFTTGQDYTRALSRSTNNQLFTPQQSDAELRAELRALNVSMERLVSTSEITAGNTGRGADAADDTLAFTVEQTL